MNRNDQLPMTNDQWKGGNNARLRPLVTGHWSLRLNQGEKPDDLS